MLEVGRCSNLAAINARAATWRLGDRVREGEREGEGEEGEEEGEGDGDGGTRERREQGQMVNGVDPPQSMLSLPLFLSFSLPRAHTHTHTSTVLLFPFPTPSSICSSPRVSPSSHKEAALRRGPKQHTKIEKGKGLNQEAK